MGAPPKIGKGATLSRPDPNTLINMDKETPQARTARKLKSKTMVPSKYKGFVGEAMRGHGTMGEVAGKHGDSLS